MSQKLAEQKQLNQTKKILAMWKKLDKSSYENASNDIEKIKLKGELYTQLQELWLKKYGKPVPRSTIRRTINTDLKQNK